MNRNHQHELLEVLAGITLAAIALSVLIAGCGPGLAAGWDWTKTAAARARRPRGQVGRRGPLEPSAANST